MVDTLGYCCCWCWGGGLLAGLAWPLIVSSRTGAPTVVVPATSDEEEGVSVLGAEAEETDGAETSGGVGDEHEHVAGVADD